MAFLVVGYDQHTECVNGPAYLVRASEVYKNPVVYERMTAKLDMYEESFLQNSTNLIPLAKTRAEEVWAVHYITEQAQKRLQMDPLKYLFTLRASVLRTPGFQPRLSVLRALNQLERMVRQQMPQYVQNMKELLDNRFKGAMLPDSELIVQYDPHLSDRQLFQVLAHTAVKEFIKKPSDFLVGKPFVEWKVDAFTTVLESQLRLAYTCLLMSRALNDTTGKYADDALERILLGTQTASLSRMIQAFGGRSFFGQQQQAAVLQDLLLDFMDLKDDTPFIEELLKYSFMMACSIPNLQDAYAKWAPPIEQKLPLPTHPFLQERIKQAREDLGFQLKRQELKTTLNRCMAEYNCTERDLRNAQREMRNLVGRPIQNVETKICTTCGDAYPLMKQFLYNKTIAGVDEKRCPACCACKIEKACQTCIGYARTKQNLRCDPCQAQRTGYDRTRWFATRGKKAQPRRWHSLTCSQCETVYYTRALPKPMPVPLRCAYCIASIPNPYKGTILEKEQYGKKLDPEHPVAMKYNSTLRLLELARTETNNAKYKLRQHLALQKNESATHEQKRNIIVDEKEREMLLQEVQQRIVEEAKTILLVDMSSVPIPLISCDQYKERHEFRPWIKSKQPTSPNLPFDHIRPWSTDDNVATQFLDEYNKIGKNIDRTTGLSNGKFVFAARDRAPCCVRGVCPHNWYAAHLMVRNVTTDDGKRDRLIIIVFPGWQPNEANQVHEHELYRKKQNRDPTLSRDVNIRVFLWSELSLLSNAVGSIIK